MKKISLFLMDMSEEGKTSGVTRYLETLLRGLKTYPNIEVCWIRLVHSQNLLIHRIKKVDNHIEYIIPLPINVNSIIREAYWNKQYNSVVYHLIQDLLKDKQNILIHIHTLNLIDLALYIKERINCKIITHIHCIPWKGLFNYDIKRFNYLYEKMYIDSTGKNNKDYIISEWEYRAYTKADSLICVTQCGAGFLNKTITDTLPPIYIIPNGIEDFCKEEKKKINNKKTIHLIYAGTISPSKGLSFILAALHNIQKKGYKNYTLKIAGTGHPALVQSLISQYKDVKFDFLGELSFTQLRRTYKKSDIGIIASLQEQSSYTAIEMAMHGLAIITTAVDGLNEMFNHEENALKTDTTFNLDEGLKVNLEMLENQLIELIENVSKRHYLQKQSRNLYLEKMTAKLMINETISVYEQLTK